MIDPMTSLAFSVYSGKGVHALLLGSGISRSSGIMTGWDIVQDLIRKFAAVEGKDCGERPDEWFRATYRQEPDYSDLLKRLAHTSPERMNLLRSYFEADDTDREEHRKEPTAAHHAIARLVANGYIRVVVTTNFDRLMERALEVAGVVPSVIASPNSILGAAPLSQSKCTVIKVHGDYLDTRLKNTPEELAKYDPALKRLLRQVFDEYGLIVAGWSAEWDVALKGSIEGTPNRRYTMYWSAYRDVARDASELCRKRDAQIIKGWGADEFFTALWEKVDILKEMNAPHPLTTSMAIAAQKKYLAEDKYRIQLHDLIMAESEKASKLLFADMSIQRHSPTLANYEEKIDTLIRMLAIGGYYGKATHKRLWLNCFQQLVTPRTGPKTDLSIDLDYYPSHFALYAYGIAALAAGRSSNLAYIFAQSRVRTQDRDERLLVKRLNTTLMGGKLEEAVQREDPQFSETTLPTSAYLLKRLREPLQELIPDRHRYEEHFCRFEYLNTLVVSDLSQKIWGGTFNTTPGWYFTRSSLPGHFDHEIKKFNERWSFLRAGLFDGSIDRLLEVKKGFDEVNTKVKPRYRIYY